MGKEMGGRFKREGTYVYLWLIHVDIWQKTTKFCKAIILQLKNKLKKKKIEPDNTLVQNWLRTTTRLYTVTLLI